MTLPRELGQLIPLGSTSLVVPSWLPDELRQFLEAAKSLANPRCSRLAELVQQYESQGDDLIEMYRPGGIDMKLWAATRELMLHMNTTRIAARTLISAVYGGTQDRLVTGSGKYVAELNDFMQSVRFKKNARVRFKNCVLSGTAIWVPGYSVLQDQVSNLIYDQVRSYVFTNERDIEDVEAVLEFDKLGRFVNFVTKFGSGTISGQEAKQGTDIVLYKEPLPYLPVAISYGEDRTADHEKYGGSLVGQTPGFNRILTHAYFALAQLIKWQVKSLLILSEGDGNELDLSKRVKAFAGNTALIMPRGGGGQFIQPNANFKDTLAVATSYMGFLAVLLGFPRSVFMPQDNQSAEAARLEGAPMSSQARQLAQESEAYEQDIGLKHAAYLHMSRDGEILGMKRLRELYRVMVRIEAWDFTRDPGSASAAIIGYVNAGIMRLRDAIKAVTPSLTEDEIAAMIASKQKIIDEGIKDQGGDGARDDYQVAGEDEGAAEATAEA